MAHRLAADPGCLPPLHQALDPISALFHNAKDNQCGTLKPFQANVPLGYTYLKHCTVPSRSPRTITIPPTITMAAPASVHTVGISPKTV